MRPAKDEAQHSSNRWEILFGPNNDKFPSVKGEKTMLDKVRRYIMLLEWQHPLISSFLS